MDFKSYLKESAGDLEQEVQRILDEWLKEVEKISPKLVPLARAFIKACEGGKRLRGTLVKLGYQLANSELDKEIIKIGAAYEIFHTAILAHDDIIDKSDLRRGQPTLYKALGGDHYGISQTIALGDIGFFLAVKILASADFPHEYKTKALAFFAQTVIDTGLGEALDVELPHLGGERKEEDVVAIHTLKTAQYTISGPLILGAILAGLGPTSSGSARLRGIKEFGENLGIAFQIQDDILGVFGDESELGKSVTFDIEEGKNTLLITEALKRANPAQKQILDRYYGKPHFAKASRGKGDQGIKAVRKVFLETGSLDYSHRFALKYVLRAKSVIPQLTKDQKWVRILTEMADFLVERSK